MNTEYALRSLSLGAGVQSTAVYLMALHGEFENPPTVAVFADTHWEPKAVYDHLDNLERVGGSRIPIHRVDYGNLRQDVLDVVGPPGAKLGRVSQPPFFVRTPSDPNDKGGMLFRTCTRDYKIGPVQREMKRLAGFKPRQRKFEKKVQVWMGISVDEASRMKDSRVPWAEHFYPLVERGMSRSDCLKWLRQRGYDEPRKSACIGCPYHSSSYWVDMKKNHPEEWEDAVEFDSKLRTGKLPGVTGDSFVHKRMLPLEEAILLDYDPDQIDMFDQECEGMCGV